MNFTCTHCNKLIDDVAVVLDNTHFLHFTCKPAFEARQKIIKKWEESGFLDDLKGLQHKPGIAKLYEAMSPVIINEDK